MKNKLWAKEDKKFSEFEKNIKIPKLDLSDVDSIFLKELKDFDKIPTSKGVYWIWTNEPLTHMFHNPSKPLPPKTKLIIEGKEIEGEIIYNGIAQDNIQNRIKNYHLHSKEENTISGISVDIYMRGKVISHKKKVFSYSGKGKVPYIDKKRLKTKEDVLKLFLSKEEIKFIDKHSMGNIHFRNGIKIFEPKHENYYFVVFYIGNLKSESYMSFIEKQWRNKHMAYPRLCSYSSGR